MPLEKEVSPFTLLRNIPWQTAQTSQWLFITLDVILAILGITGAFLFPPLIPFLLMGIVSINLIKLILNGKGLLAEPGFEKLVNLITLGMGTALLTLVIVMPAVAPLTAFFFSAFILINEGIRIGKEMREIVKTAQQLTRLKASEDYDSVVALKKKQLQLTLSSIESGIKIGLSLAVIGVTIGSLFFPPLAPFIGIIPAIGVASFKVYEKWVKPRLIKKLEEMVETSVSAKSEIPLADLAADLDSAPLAEEENLSSLDIATPKLTSSDSLPSFSPLTSTPAAPSTVSSPLADTAVPGMATQATAPSDEPVEWIESLAKEQRTTEEEQARLAQSLHALHCSNDFTTTACATVYTRADEAANKFFAATSAEAEQIVDAGNTLFKSLLRAPAEKPTEIRDNEIIFHLQENNLIIVHGCYIETNAPDDVIIDKIAQLAKAIGWENVSIGTPLAACAGRDLPDETSRETARHSARKHRLSLQDGQEGSTTELSGDKIRSPEHETAEEEKPAEDIQKCVQALIQGSTFLTAPPVTIYTRVDNEKPDFIAADSDYAQQIANIGLGVLHDIIKNNKDKPPQIEDNQIIFYLADNSNLKITGTKIETTSAPDEKILDALARFCIALGWKTVTLGSPYANEHDTPLNYAQAEQAAHKYGLQIAESEGRKEELTEEVAIGQTTT